MVYRINNRRDSYIVSIRVLYQSESIVGDLIDQLNPLVLGCMVNASLKYTTSMAMGSNLNAVSCNCIIDKLKIGQKRQDSEYGAHT